jgi:hypothetical protein
VFAKTKLDPAAASGQAFDISVMMQPLTLDALGMRVSPISCLLI